MELDFFIKAFLHRPWLIVSIFLYFFVFVKYYRHLSTTNRLMSVIVLIYGLHGLISFLLARKSIETSWTFNLICMPLTWMIVKLFTDNLSDKSNVKLISYISAIFLLVHILNISFFQGIRYIATYTYLILQAINAIVAFYYLKDQMDNSDTHPSLNLLNWFAAATVIDHITSIPITATLAQNMIGFTDERYTGFLYNIMSFVYGCWYLIISAGIIWNKTALSSRFLSRSSP